MQARRMNYLHGALRDWGSWCRDGMICQGVMKTSSWPSGKPVEGRLVTVTRRSGVTTTQPKETRTTAPTLPCTRLDLMSERIHPVIVALPDELKQIVIYLYIRGMGFKDISLVFNITSKQVSKKRFMVLKAVDSVV